MCKCGCHEVSGWERLALPVSAEVSNLLHAPRQVMGPGTQGRREKIRPAAEAWPPRTICPVPTSGQPQVEDPRRKHGKQVHPHLSPIIAILDLARSQRILKCQTPQPSLFPAPTSPSSEAPRPGMRITGLHGSRVAETWLSSSDAWCAVSSTLSQGPRPSAWSPNSCPPL